MLTQHNKVANKTPAIRGNKKNNSRRGIEKLTTRSITTDKPYNKQSLAVVTRKHKKTTLYYLDELDIIDGDFHINMCNNIL
jgi:hypothetical protein